MKLVGFSIAKDCIALECSAKQLDLHNNFTFSGLTFDPIQRTLNLSWSRALGAWVKADEPTGLQLTFSGVYLFKTHERDPELAFKEDACLDAIGFIWNNLLSEMHGHTTNQPRDKCTHLIAVFNSGFSIKVGADTVVLQVTSGA